MVSPQHVVVAPAEYKTSAVGAIVHKITCPSPSHRLRVTGCGSMLYNSDEGFEVVMVYGGFNWHRVGLIEEVVDKD